MVRILVVRGFVRCTSTKYVDVFANIIDAIISDDDNPPYVDESLAYDDI